MELREQAEPSCYYLIQEGTGPRGLGKRRRVAEPLNRVPLITSYRRGQSCVMSTSKPVVKLLINRNNNKYSYTATSADSFLRNIELFEKLSIRFSGRVLFVKEIGVNEICCWTYFGHGQKCAEVCCSSIVYAPNNKKHTKVEFPEARIYEEMLAILLYENPTGPDPELMQATSSRVNGRPVSNQY